MNGLFWVIVNIYVVYVYEDLIWKNILFDVVELKYFVKVKRLII